MAACDNLYGTLKEWIQLRDFLFEHNPAALKHMKPKPDECDGEVRICYTADIQDWLIVNCPFKWVQKRLKLNMGIQDGIGRMYKL